MVFQKKILHMMKMVCNIEKDNIFRSFNVNFKKINLSIQEFFQIDSLNLNDVVFIAEIGNHRSRESTFRKKFQRSFLSPDSLFFDGYIFETIRISFENFKNLLIRFKSDNFRIGK